MITYAPYASDSRYATLIPSFNIFGYFENLLLRSNASIILPSKNDKRLCKKDVSLHTVDNKGLDLFHEEIRTPSVAQSVSSHCSNPSPLIAASDKLVEIVDATEILLVACMDCYYSREVLNLGDHVDCSEFKPLYAFEFFLDCW